MTEPHVSARDSESIPDVPQRLAELAREGSAVAVATVISRRAPVSAQVGDKALIHADGRMEGFVGGACSREIVRRQALLSLQGGQARLVVIVPGAAPQDAEHAFAERVTVPMNCASEGASEVFIEPLLPPRLLVVVGHTPVAQAIATHARVMGDRVWRVLDDDEAGAHGEGPDVVPLSELADRLAGLPAAQRARARSVVASQGHYDESALEVLLRAQPNPVGLLASRKRAENVRETLRVLSSFGDAELERIRGPVGLDLGARTPHEVAVSVLAEMVQLDRAGKGRVPVAAVPEGSAGTPPAEFPAAAPSTPAPPAPATASPLLSAVMGLDALPVAASRSATDPVCGMTVTLPAKHTAEHAGQEYAFCCPHCKARFLKEPAAYIPG
ncbi:XdhC family protein [uncultured Deinococcus sp.]|uniref:XdhC family protein n=1 Tax=uncultured Deinococcus sp. TaxID=158789 RepID=UPI0025D65DB0|nr:XdhC family protein [uncultured Deinococcus sp.]